MSRWVVAAPGESLTVEQLERVRALPLVAVNDAFKLAPWAQALAANDAAWWRARPEAFEFAGRRFAVQPVNTEVEALERNALIATGTNSGLLGIEVARRVFGATEILLLGFDMKGSHYFGPHTGGLKNPDEETFGRFQFQIAQWAAAHRQVKVVNCTPGSVLATFPRRSLDACLA